MSADMSELRTDIPIPIGMSAMSSVPLSCEDKSAATCKTGAEQVGPTGKRTDRAMEEEERTMRWRRSLSLLR
jgi:hypothetical protein